MLIFLILAGAVAAADAAGATPAVENARLRVKPLLCIADRVTGKCAARFHMRWDSGRTGDFCVGTELEAAPLRCWSAAKSGEHVDERSVAESFAYWLADGASDRRLVSANVEVLRLDSTDRRRDRRSRHVWDVL